jgi:tripartite-type tricarboxylate transporter receptor subunit TctC
LTAVPNIRAGKVRGYAVTAKARVAAAPDIPTVEALADPGVNKRLGDLGQNIPPREQQSPEALGAYQKAEIDKWWPLIKAAGMKAE